MQIVDGSGIRPTDPGTAENTMTQTKRPKTYPVAESSSEASENVSQNVSKAAQAVVEGRIGDAVQAGLDAVKDVAQTAGHLAEGN
jgi:hypothetical protein